MKSSLTRKDLFLAVIVLVLFNTLAFTVIDKTVQDEIKEIRAVTFQQSHLLREEYREMIETQKSYVSEQQQLSSNLVDKNPLAACGYDYAVLEFNQESLIMQPSKVCEQAKKSDLVSFNPYGTSMAPFIYSWYKTRGVEFQEEKHELVEGDIVVFNKNNNSVSHMVRAVYRDYVIICGTNDVYRDGWNVCDKVNYSDVTHVICEVSY